MTRYILKRLLSLIPVLFVVSLAVFLLIHLVPGDPAAAMLGDLATQEQIESYAALLSSYDRLVQENIKTAEENARKFAELAARLHATVPQILSADGKLIEAPAMEADNEIPIHVVGEKPNAPEEKLWTVSELSKEAAEEMPVDELIDEILGASTARESSGSVR